MIVPILVTLVWLLCIAACALPRVGEWKAGRWTFFYGPVEDRLVFSFRYQR